jgi:hypothetical protein
MSIPPSAIRTRQPTREGVCVCLPVPTCTCHPSANMTSNRQPSVPYQAPAYNNIPGSSPYYRNAPPPPSRQVALFEPDQPQRPSNELMQHFITLFFEHMGREFAFITYEEIVRLYWEQSLPPHLANCIAGMASRSAPLLPLLLPSPPSPDSFLRTLDTPHIQIWLPEGYTM